MSYWAERLLRLVLCRLRGHRWTTPIGTMAGGMAFVNGSSTVTSGILRMNPDDRWICGRCGKAGARLSEVGFSVKTYDPFGIW